MPVERQVDDDEAIDYYDVVRTIAYPTLLRRTIWFVMECSWEVWVVVLAMQGNTLLAAILIFLEAAAVVVWYLLKGIVDLCSKDIFNPS